LDPRYATDATSARVNRLLYEQLVDFDSTAQPVPALAEWRIIAPAHYRFQLRPAHFHNGDPVTARDVRATYEYILDRANASPHRATLANLARIEVIDEATVDFHLRAADALFPGKLVIGILPATLITGNHPFNQRPLGSGPFEFVAWPESGRLRIRRRADGQEIEFLLVKDPTVRILKLLRGELDLAQNDLPPELVRYAAAQPELQVRTGQGSNFTYLGFNMEDEVVGMLAVRRAIAHALDRDAIIRYVLGGAARPASALLPPDHWAGARPGNYEHDPIRARALLRAAGYDEQHRPSIVYKTSSDPVRIRLATIIQQQLAEVGIDVELRSYDWGTFYGDIKAGRFQMFSLSWVGIKMPDIFKYVFHSRSLPPVGANRGRYISATADDLIEAAESAPTLAEQADYYHRLQAYLFEELPYVPLWYEDHVAVMRRGVSDYALVPDGNYDGLRTVHYETIVGTP
jgi:peptide/nickel transport system substrate-binding protein